MYIPESLTATASPLTPLRTVVASPPAFTVAPLPGSDSPPTSTHETPDTEIAIVVPPTPTPQLLPLEETDGVTSGAVQAPGSTGDEIKTDVRVTVGESDESDGSFDDEPFGDGRQIESWEEEEARLIRQGGTGIPIGPVCITLPVVPHIHIPQPLEANAR